MENNQTTVRPRRSAAPTVALIVLLFFCALTIQEFFSLRDFDFSMLLNEDITEASQQLFPLFGLIAFVMVWFQVVLGSNGWWLYRRAPGLLAFHRTHGVLACCFALLHPLLLLIGFGWVQFIRKTFVSPELRIYATIGSIQLTLLTITVLAALFRRVPWLRRHWKKFHILNYAAFILIWVHSWFLGADVQSTWFRYLWMFFALTVVVSLLARVIHVVKAKRQPPVHPPATIFSGQPDQSRPQI